MNKEEKEAAVALGVAAVLAAVVCILSFETCAVGFIIAVVAFLWAYTWSKIFGDVLEEVRRQQIQSHNKQRCVSDN
jgi:hypothetical protein